MRRGMLQKVFGDRVKIYPLPDIGVGNNSTWGEYVLQNIAHRFHRAPDLLVSGKEERRLDWFDGVSVQLSELYVPKLIDISATQMRAHLIEGNLEAWKKYTCPALWEDYEALRQAVIAAKDNLETASM